MSVSCMPVSRARQTVTFNNQDFEFDFFPQTLSHILRWVRLVQKTRAKNSHAWAPLKGLSYEIELENIDVN